MEESYRFGPSKKGYAGNAWFWGLKKEKKSHPECLTKAEVKQTAQEKGAQTNTGQGFRKFVSGVQLGLNGRIKEEEV